LRASGANDLESARAGMGHNSHRLPAIGIDERGGHLAIVFDAQRSVSHPTARCHRYSIGKAAVRLDDSQQSLTGLRQVQAQLAPGQQAHSHAQDLARAQVMVQSGRLP
jgi:hypothetical protein